MRSAPHRLVDGKFLAMTCIVSGRFAACGRDLQPSDISALDDYIHRCKLGPYRPGRAVALAQQASSSPTSEQRESAAKARHAHAYGSHALPNLRAHEVLLHTKMSCFA
ncbi:RHBDL3 [Symbiodinium pilosum]|uniref:RHBDL3 protein n=1 Tax=Symbiodinium pilosum TaxID=2952 RepID=A0A812WVS9_SYMPI|nr:RHBDL3 [Symbiodinium pilosum]